MSTFSLFPQFPKELRLKIYTHTFSPRILQLGTDAGMPYPQEMKLLGRSPGPKKKLHTQPHSLFAVCAESRDLCKSIFVPFGPTFIHPKLDTLYISQYAIARMRAPEYQAACNDDEYSVKVFDKVAIEFGLKDNSIPKTYVAWKEQPKKWQLRYGVREFCAPGVWPVTDYAEFFRCFGIPREVLLVTGGELKWAAGNWLIASWRSIELVPTEMESGDQESLVMCLKAQLSSAMTENSTEFAVVDVRKEHLTFMPDCPYSWRTWLDVTERYMWA